MKFKVGQHQIEIDQDTLMGDLSHVFEIGNAYRENRGDKPTTIDEWLADDQTIEFVRDIEQNLGVPLIRHIGEKTFAHIYLMLDASAYIDDLLKFEMTNVYLMVT